MQRLLSEIVKKISNSISFQITTLAIITISFFHEAFRMQFWKDDYALLYILQQNERVYFPYQHLRDLHILFFPVFGINPLGYFSLGVIFVFISSLLFYYLIYKLFSSKIIAFIATVIYITSPVGIDSALMAMTFATDYFALVLLFLILICLISFYEKKKIIYYFISLIILAVSIELVSFRSFYYGGLMILFETINLKPSLITVIKKLFYLLKNKIKSTTPKAIYAFDKKDKISIRNFILRQLLIIFMWFFVLYIVPVYLFPDALKYHPETNAKTFSGIVNYKLLLNPLLTGVNILLTGISYIFYRDFYLAHNLFIALAVLIAFLLFSIYLLAWFRKKDKRLLNIYMFGVGYLYLSSLAIYPYTARGITEATHRYLTNSLPAYGILIVCVYIFLSNIVRRHKRVKLLPIFFLLLVLTINTVTTQAYLKEFNTRSYYSTQFSKQIKAFIPQLPKNSLVYVQLNEDPNVNYRLLDTSRGGHYDDKAYFAVLYNMKQEDLNSMIVNYSVLLDRVKSKSINPDKIFAFSYSWDGLTDITKKVREYVSRDLKNSSKQALTEQ